MNVACLFFFLTPWIWPFLPPNPWPSSAFPVFQWWTFNFVQDLFTSFLISFPKYFSLTLFSLASPLSLILLTFLSNPFVQFFYFLSFQSFLPRCVCMRKFASPSACEWLKLCELILWSQRIYSNLLQPNYLENVFCVILRKSIMKRTELSYLFWS